MKNRIGWIPLIVLALPALSACTIYYDRKFIPKEEAPPAFESWHPDVYVFAEVHTAKEWRSQHRYSVTVTVSTRVNYYTDPKHKKGLDWRCAPSDYDAHLDEVRLETRAADSSWIDLPLGTLWEDSGECSASLSSRELVAIPASVRELRAHVTVTFRRKEAPPGAVVSVPSGRDSETAETRVFVVVLKKYEEAIPFFRMV